MTLAMLSQLLDDFTNLYNQGDYTTAYDHLTTSEIDLPDYRAAIHCWRVSMAARMGNTNLALQLLEEARHQGWWYHEGALLHDPDFALLQGEAAFKTLVEEFRAARLQDAEKTHPQRMILEPVGFSGPRPLLLAMHGNLGNMASFAPFFHAAVRAGWIVAVLQSSQLMWVSGLYQWDDMERSLAEVALATSDVCRQYEVDLTQVVLLGFSKSGDVAAQAVLSGRVQARGFIAMEAFSEQSTAWEAYQSLVDGAQPALRVFISVGQIAQDIQDGAQHMSDLLKRRGLACHLEHTSNTVHALPPHFDDFMLEALSYIQGL